MAFEVMNIMFGQSLISTRYSVKILNTLESGVDVGQGINVGPWIKVGHHNFN